ncbi:phospholipid carrier-dependent glycosyltransferase [Candidatus Gracilibacteria bacterium]|nr:phospholipid carrier-dependent glycosyltransferase [Candidatus Gracilibacteria bacterium]
MTIRIAVLSVLLVGLILRLPRTLNLPIWSDEYHTIRLMRLPLADLLRGRYEELNPPLYFALIHVYTSVFGEAEVVLRSFSLLMAFIALVLLWLVARELLHDELGALLALTVAALNPFFVYYATEVRSYALLSALGLATLYTYLRLRRAEERAWRWTSLLALGVAASAYTHHFGLMIVLMIGVFIVVDAWGQRWTAAHTRACAAVGLGLLL